MAWRLLRRQLRLARRDRQGLRWEFTAEEYATEYRRYTAWVPQYGVELALIGSGPNRGDLTWTRGFFSRLLEKGEGQLRRSLVTHTFPPASVTRLTIDLT